MARANHSPVAIGAATPVAAADADDEDKPSQAVGSSTKQSNSRRKAVKGSKAGPSIKDDINDNNDKKTKSVRSKRNHRDK